MKKYQHRRESFTTSVRYKRNELMRQTAARFFNQPMRLRYKEYNIDMPIKIAAYRRAYLLREYPIAREPAYRPAAKIRACFGLTLPDGKGRWGRLILSRLKSITSLNAKAPPYNSSGRLESHTKRRAE
jgi:hypothetical protein